MPILKKTNSGNLLNKYAKKHSYNNTDSDPDIKLNSQCKNFEESQSVRLINTDDLIKQTNNKILKESSYIIFEKEKTESTKDTSKDHVDFINYNKL